MRNDASARDDSAALHGLASVAETEEDARADVRRPAMALSTGGSGALSPSSTIADAVELWLSQVLTRDVDITTQPRTLIVNGTIVSNKIQGTHRRDSSKRSRQRRSIALPSTAATLVGRPAGITLASRLLGHANEQTTRNSYVVTADQVDPVTSELLDAVLGG